MKKVLAIAVILLMLGGCASKDLNTKMDKNGNYVPQTDYQAYTLAKSHEPQTFDRFSIKGAKFIKIKAGWGEELELTVTDEFKNKSTLEKPKSWFDRTMDTVDRAFPVVGSVARWYMGWQFGESVVDGLSKDPVVVEQRFDTMTSHDTVTETVEVVNQQELVIVEQPLIVETPVDNSTNTINNNYSVPEVEEPILGD